MATGHAFKFEWHQARAVANLAKHEVSFDEAATVFADPNGLDGPDVRHSIRERRFLRLGWSASGRVLMVAYTQRRSGDVDTIRLISAGRASRKERAAYANAQED
jgi:hypothetical protein